MSSRRERERRVRRSTMVVMAGFVCFVFVFLFAGEKEKRD